MWSTICEVYGSVGWVFEDQYQSSALPPDANYSMWHRGAVDPIDANVCYVPFLFELVTVHIYRGTPVSYYTRL